MKRKTEESQSERESGFLWHWGVPNKEPKVPPQHSHIPFHNPSTLTLPLISESTSPPNDHIFKSVSYEEIKLKDLEVP